MKLIDAVGGEEVAKDWLVKEKGLDKDLKLVDWKPKRVSERFLFGNAALNWLFGQFGLGANHPEEMLPNELRKRLFLDGLLSIWHG